jgi:DNA mismatch repair protein MutS
MAKQLTPMMQQYFELKEKYKDSILFFRLGDFYEMFFEDALTASKELEITLTGRDCGQEEKAPMCGVPHHASENYINRLIEKGYKVAICEQVEDVNASKGIVKRDVVRIVTRGTNLNMQSLDETKNNYLMCIYQEIANIGIAYVDITTGDFNITYVNTAQRLIDEVAKVSPSEIIYNETLGFNLEVIEILTNRLNIFISQGKDWYFDCNRTTQTIKNHFNVATLDGLGLSELKEAKVATGALFEYIFETQKAKVAHITRLNVYSTSEYMTLDISTRRNLELVETLRSKERRGSLLWVLDQTKTAMGARMLRSYIEQPLIDKAVINKRLDAVEELVNKPILSEEIKELLNPIYDLERLMGKVSCQTANCRDLIAFKQSLSMLPHIQNALFNCSSQLLVEMREEFDTLYDLYDLIDQSIVDEPPISVKEGNMIKADYHEEVKLLRAACTDGTQWIANLEAKEREETGIKNLKIKYNKVFGYHIEVTRSYYDLVPERYTRKQTMANAERYITSELKDMENKILGAQEKVVALEYALFVEIRNNLGKEVARIKKTAQDISLLDVIRALSEVAYKYNFVRPIMTSQEVIDIKDGRHPVVEKMMSNDMFIPNDTYLDDEAHRFSIITGPNMAGKSTYMRQVALIVLMAQIGSFVPASQAKIGPVDRIFTRVGASDDLASGQSTFMVEMTEVANILRNATRKSLVILDEIGRGTSTFDGLSIAWAVVEYITDLRGIGAKTLFATHYHELTELEGTIDGVQNYCISVKENGDDIIFLRKIIKGGADKSYGIQVAKLAGVPENVIERAKEILEELTDADITKQMTNTGVIQETQVQLDLFSKDFEVERSQSEKNKETDKKLKQYENLIEKGLKQIDINTITPIEALNILGDLIAQASR